MLKLIQNLMIVEMRVAIILMGVEGLLLLLKLSSQYFVNVSVMWLFLTVPWIGLQCVILVFPDHTPYISGLVL